MKKTGIDDFLAAGGSLEDLESRATAHLPDDRQLRAARSALPKKVQRMLETPSLGRLLRGQVDDDEDPTPESVDRRLVFTVALMGQRDEEVLGAVLRYRLAVSDRREKPDCAGYVRSTVVKALDDAKAAAAERVDAGLGIREIVCLRPDGQAQETTYRVVGEGGWTVELDRRTLLDARAMREVALSETGRLPAPVKQRDWDAYLALAFEDRSRTEVVPEEASNLGFLKCVVVDAISNAPAWSPWSAEDVELHPGDVPFPHRRAETDEVLATMSSLLVRLRVEYPILNPNPRVLGRIFRELGGVPGQRRFGRWRPHLWAFPRASLPVTGEHEDEVASDTGARDGRDGRDVGDREPQEADPPVTPERFETW